MIITLDKTYYARVDSPLLGYMGETESRTITVQGYQTEDADRYILRLSYADGAQYDVDITDGAYTVQASLLRAVGNVKCQVLAVKSTGADTYEYVKKSNVFVVTIKQSVGGDIPVPTYEETVAVLDKVLAAEIAADECIAARDTAVTAAGTATDKATTAVDKANEATRSAEISAENASQTTTDRAAVETAKADVLSARDTAVSSADTAKEKAQTAIDSAATASTAAETAVQASNAAQAARTAAEQAATEAEDNKTIAVNAAQTAAQAADMANSAADTAVSARDTAVSAQADVTAKAQTVATSAAQVAEDRQTVQSVAESIPTEYSDLSASVDELKGDLDEVIATGFEVVSSYNRVNPDTINVGKYVNSINGSLLENNKYNATDFIPIKKDHIYAFIGNSSHWAVYNADKTFISQPTYSAINGYVVFTASEDGYIRFSYYSNGKYGFVEINKDADVNMFKRAELSSIFYDNKVIEKETKEDFSTYLYNLMDASKIKVGYYGDTVNVNYDTTDWMELPSEPLTIYNKSLKIVTARTVWYADRDFNQIYYQDNTSEILAETPTFAKAKYFRYSVSTGRLENTMVFPSSIAPFKFFEYGDKCLRKEYISPYLSASDAKVEALKGTNGLKISADMLTSNTSLKLNDFPSHLKKGIAITADMKFSAFSKVSIGKGYESYRGDWIEIDDTNVIYKHYEESTSTASTVAHGLTIKDSLSIALYIDNDGVCNVSLATNGGSADFSIKWKYEQNGKPFIIGEQEMTEVNLSAIALDAKCPIWLFGDSYFGVAENRVIGQLKNLGYTDGVLVDGMAGIGTSSMLDDLQKLIALGGSPKIVICCEGMNDGGSGYASNINAIIGMCDGVGAELVLYKVPVVAKRITENTAVNTTMLATGKRYVDAYKAVGATDEGTWWDGYLNSDGVHPNEIGAKAIAQRILIDVPEIMQYGRKVGNVSGDISGDK